MLIVTISLVFYIAIFVITNMSMVSVDHKFDSKNGTRILISLQKDSHNSSEFENY